MGRVPIKNYEGLYSIDILGNVYSEKSNKIKSLDYSRNYPSVCLFKNGKGLHHSIHRLLAIEFIDNPLNKEQVNHIDGNKSNYKLENLEWVTSSENMIHARDNDLMNYVFGEKCGFNKLTEKQALSCFNLYSEGHSMGEISKILNVSRSIIGLILNNKRWKHLDGEVEIEDKYTKGLQIKDQYGNVYKSMTYAAQKLKLSVGNIHSVVNGKRKSTCGYIFFLNKEEE